MNDQAIAMLTGFGVVVGLRLLDWVFPKGTVWRKMQEWSISRAEAGLDDENRTPGDDRPN